MAKFKPFGEFVVIQPTEPRGETVSEGGSIVIPQSAEKVPYAEGTVISVGETNTWKLQPQTRVIYARHAAVEAPYAGQDLILVKQAQIVGQINR